jgi:hypothetical protein
MTGWSPGYCSAGSDANPVSLRSSASRRQARPAAGSESRPTSRHRYSSESIETPTPVATRRDAPGPRAGSSDETSSRAKDSAANASTSRSPGAVSPCRTRCPRSWAPVYQTHPHHHDHPDFQDRRLVRNVDRCMSARATLDLSLCPWIQRFYGARLGKLE